ncbi:hypothetical protein MMC08_005484 [Hypocenomyce scalaris]|nr:hypothetical protein [Hypocenomyce scalaris]
MKTTIFLTSLAALTGMGAATPVNSNLAPSVPSLLTTTISPTATTPTTSTDAPPTCTTTMTIVSNPHFLQHATAIVYLTTVTLFSEVNCHGCTAVDVQTIRMGHGPGCATDEVFHLHSDEGFDYLDGHEVFV